MPSGSELASPLRSAAAPLWDYVFSLLAIFGVSVPIFWLGLLLMLLFALQLGWLPATGMDGAAAFVLPALTLGLNAAALIARITRSSVLDVLGQDFVRTAHAKGASPRRVLWVHVLRNGAIPILTVSALQFGYLLGGAVLTETVFVWPGLGRLLTDAILQRDFPVIQGGILIVALSMILLNLVTDLLYAVADPRIHPGSGTTDSAWTIPAQLGSLSSARSWWLPRSSVALAAPWLAPANPAAANLEEIMQPPRALIRSAPTSWGGTC